MVLHSIFCIFFVFLCIMLWLVVDISKQPNSSICLMKYLKEEKRHQHVIVSSRWTRNGTRRVYRKRKAIGKLISSTQYIMYNKWKNYNCNKHTNMWRHNNNVQYNNVIYTFGIYQLCSCGHRESTHIVIVIHSRVCFVFSFFITSMVQQVT